MTRKVSRRQALVAGAAAVVAGAALPALAKTEPVTPEPDHSSEAWEPGMGDPNAYSLEVTSGSLRPILGQGDVLIISPGAHLTNRCLAIVKMADGAVGCWRWLGQGKFKVHLLHLPTQEMRFIPHERVAFVHRIVCIMPNYGDAP